MRKPVFKGAATALVTPFTDNGINYTKLEELIEFQIEKSIDCILICGTTGEASTMPDKEHKKVIDFAVRIVKGRVPLIAGTGSNDTLHAVELSKYAEFAGADALLSVTPYYNKTTQAGLYEHFKIIATNVSIPVILYNVPSRTNLNINPETYEKLSEIENIIGVKECNLLQVAEIANKCGEDFYIYSGEDGHVVPLLSLGGIGVISVMANIIPEDTHTMVKSFLEGDILLSRRLQLKTVELIKALFCEVNPIPIKAAMNLMGMNLGHCRLPLVQPSDKTMDILKNALINYGLVK